MAPSQTIAESRIIELAEESFNTFCEDISGMFGIDMKCVPQPVGHETVKGLQARFQDLAVVYSARAEGAFDSTLKLVFDQQGLFILAGVVAMQPEQMILEDTKSGSLEKAAKTSNILKEVGTALTGAWERVFSKGLDGHGRFVQTDTFVGNPWDTSEEKIGLAADEEFVFVPYEMTVGPYPAFKCGVIFQKAIVDEISEPETDQLSPTGENAQEETESSVPNVSEGAEETVAADDSAAKHETEAVTEQIAEVEAEEKAQVEPEQAAQENTEENIEGDTEQTAQVEAEEKAQVEPEQAAQEGTEENIAADTEQTAEEEAEEKAQVEPEQAAQENTEENITGATEQTAQEEVEEKAQAEPEQAAQENTEENIKGEVEQTVQGQKTDIEKVDSDESDTTQQSDNEKSEPQEPTVEVAIEEQTQAQEDTEQTADTEEDTAADEKVQPVDEEIFAADESAAKQEPEADAEQMPNDIEETATVEMDEKQERPVSETIQKMTESPAVLPGEETQSPTAEKTTLSGKDTSLIICAKDIMQKDVIWANPDESVQQALAKIQQHNAGYMMVGRENVLEGIVSKSDLTGALSPYLRTIFVKWRRPLDDATLKIRIKWIMSKATCTIVPDTPLAAIMENMCQAGIRCLPVVDEQGGVQGLVTAFDIFKVLLKQSYLS